MSRLPAQQRRRKRRLPVTPPGYADAVPADGRRAYCPACGEVQRDYGTRQALEGNDVIPHLREIAAAVKEKGRCGEAVTTVECPGGTIDPVKDRAP
ncbi:hypothetical protein [Streptomyces atriruber]|uniref:hypothetical protein n=1 Tax=Streptomyces atriruber TaxID=545121 RepID=UPI0006E2226E|nr:hypothetical protein [Streptomyces atriruber]